MKYAKITVLGLLLAGMTAPARAQIFQVFEKNGQTAKYQAAEVDSISHRDGDGLTTLHLRSGKKQTFQKAETDSIVWYDPAGSILSTLKAKGNYTCFLRLVGENSLWSDMLNGATDLTVFAATDDKWQQFFQKNGITYEALTQEQKQRLLAAAVTQSSLGGNLRVRGMVDGQETWTPLLTPAYCQANGITEQDQLMLAGSVLTAPWSAGAAAPSQTQTTNGTVYDLTAPITPLATMGDIIRRNGKTNIMAHIIDAIKTYVPDPNSYAYPPQLKYDPDQAGYHDEDAPEADMAAMYVPSDDAMWDFFTNGGGQMLVRTYHAKQGTADEVPYTMPTTHEELFRQIDDIPLSTLQPLVNIIMMRSFRSSVPSKMTQLRDDAMSQFFFAEDRNKIQDCLLACNGMVYIMNGVYGPQDFLSITAPVYISETNRIMKWAIYDQAAMGLNFFAYLKAPQQELTLFMPTDEAFRYYYDPSSMKSRTPRVLELSYKNAIFPITARSYNYFCPYNKDKGEVGTIGSALQGSVATISQGDIMNRLKEVLYVHTIVGDVTNSRNEYFATLGGDVVKVVRDGSGRIVGAKGTFQLENERQGVASETPGVTGCTVTQSFESLSNGKTYAINAPLVPTYRSLWSILSDDADTYSWMNNEFTADTPYSEFLKLCSVDEDALIACGLVDGRVFARGNGLDYNLGFIGGNTPVTVYIPTNEAVRMAISNGLPTWEEITEDYRSHCKPSLDWETGQPEYDSEGNPVMSNELATTEDSLRIANKVTTLMNVIKAHFHYGLAIADVEPFQSEFKTLAMNDRLASQRVKVSSQGNGQMTVTDWNGRSYDIVGEKNIFFRDILCNKTPVNVAMTNISVDRHNAGVIHQIDGVLGWK